MSPSTTRSTRASRSSPRAPVSPGASSWAARCTCSRSAIRPSPPRSPPRSTCSPAGASSSASAGGENPKEFEACGVPVGERGARVNEGIEVVRTLWRESPATFKGRFTQFEGVSIDPKPVQQPGPPIWIGGRSDAALRRAGRQGDGWVSYAVHPARFGQSLEKIHAAATEAGRSLDGFTAAIPVRRAARALRPGGLPLLPHESHRRGPRGAGADRGDRRRDHATFPELRRRGPEGAGGRGRGHGHPLARP